MARQMKDSGVEWIDEIPEEWEVARLKQVFNFGKGLPITKEDLVDKGIPVISYGQIHAKSNTGVTVQQELIRYVPDVFRETNFDSFVSKNDFILADTSEDLLGCGNCVFVDREMELFAGYHTIILRSTTTQDNKYIAYLFLTDAWRSQIRSKVSGVKLFSISRKILSEATVLVPPKDVQRRIAAFLDRRCAEIDAVIERTKATIEEYKKLKQAVITEAVTKGVRGPRPMKDSGIEWIGEIPEGWEVLPHKYVMHKEKSICEHYAGEDIISLTMNGVIVRDLTAGGKMPTTFDGYQYVEPDDMLLCLFDIDVTPRCVGIVRNHGVTSPAYSRFKVHVGYYNAYYDYLLRFIDDEKVFIHLSKNLRSSLTETDFGAIKTISPSYDEQVEIAIYLDEKCAAIDTLIAKKTALLTELETYKKSLIYEYVTGKKEVPACP